MKHTDTMERTQQVQMQINKCKTEPFLFYYHPGFIIHHVPLPPSLPPSPDRVTLPPTTFECTVQYCTGTRQGGNVRVVHGQRKATTATGNEHNQDAP